MSHKSSSIQAEANYVFDIKKDVLDSLQLMYFDSATAQEINTWPKQKSPLTRSSVESKNKDAAVRDQEYFKSDLHKLNLKREIRGLPALSEKEFEELADDLNESISGSEASDSDSDSYFESEDEKDRLETIFEKSIKKLEQLKLAEDEDEESFVSHLATKSPYILFKSHMLSDDKCFGIYKALFTIKELEAPIDALKSWKANGAINKKSALLMIGGGHFAGAIINHKPRSTKGNIVKPGDSLLQQAVDVVVSKSFHRYTTRRKQGGSQSASDNARGKANSAGSSLRRHNEIALTQDVRELLQSWKELLTDCDSIYIRANGTSNRKVLVDYEGSVLKNSDPRIKSFPFTTKRATTTELKRAWVQLTYMATTTKPKVDDKVMRKKQTQEQLKQSIIAKEKEVNEVSEYQKHTKEIIGYLKKARGPVLAAYLKKHKISPDFLLEPEKEYYATPTMLHYVAANGIKNLVPILIKNLKVDPTVQNKSGKTAYEVSANRATKLAFQIARHDLGESSVDWETARVGQPISKEAVEQEDREVQEREEQEKKDLIRKEQEKIAAEETAEKAKTPKILGGLSQRQRDFNLLTEEQKMRVMREQRARAAEARLKQMHK